MSKLPLIEKGKPLSRRQLIKLGVAGAGIAGASLAFPFLIRKKTPLVKIPPLPGDTQGVSADFNPMTVVRDFDYGTVKRENGRTIREFKITAKNSTLQLNSAIAFNSWNFNGRVPGPTLRATEGDRIRVIFYNKAGHSHSLHFHGVHTSEMDGVKPVKNGSVFIYEFDANPYGVHLYHCHIEPVTRHIGKGLYGMFIIDPPKPRPPADEIMLIMGGYD